MRDCSEFLHLVPEYSPNGVIWCCDGVIEYANPRARQLLQIGDACPLCGRSVMAIAHQEAAGRLADYLHQLSEANAIVPIELALTRSDGVTVIVELSGTAFILEGRRMIQMIFRDITDRKHELAQAMEIQRRMFQVESPLPDKVSVEVVYRPAQTISGDSFHLRKTSHDHLLGLIADGTGKGVAAALNTSALRIAFEHTVEEVREPHAILQHLNEFVADHFQAGDYISACCFSLDLADRKLVMSSGGVHRFHHCGQSGCRQFTVAGSPLGMFATSEFDQVAVDFVPGDRFWFYTDGVDEALHDLEFVAQLASAGSLVEQRMLMRDKLLTCCFDDDCTWLGVEVV